MKICALLTNQLPQPATTNHSDSYYIQQAKAALILEGSVSGSVKVHGLLLPGIVA